MEFGASIIAPVMLLVGMSIFSVVVGVYLLKTNPPKDDSKFVGFNAEKMSDEELGGTTEEQTISSE